MILVVNGLLRGEFLRLPGVGKAATVGVISTVMAIGLQILGFPYNKNAITAAFTIAGAGGALITVVASIAYSIIVIGKQQGQNLYPYLY